MNRPVVIFLGPTLEASEAKRLHPDFDIRPPAARGDVIRAVDDGAAVIGIVDGFFEAVPSVWHKEIISAMEQGVRVLGSSSMGALRAVELAPLGMEGIGVVQQMVASGEVDDDDVALVHAPAEFDYRAFSRPLVNLRCSVAHSVADNIVSRAFGEALVAAQKRRFYPDRTTETLTQDALEVDPVSGADFISWLAEHGVDQKRLDALDLLDAAKIASARAGGDRRRPRLERTVSFEAMAAEERSLRSATRALPQPAFVELALQPDRYLQTTSLAMRRRAAREAAERQGFAVDEDAIERASDRLRRRLGLLAAADVERWLEACELTIDDYAALIEREALVARGAPMVSAVDGDDIRDVLSVRGAWRELAGRAAAKAAALATERNALRDLSPSIAWEWWCTQHGLEGHPDDLAAGLGFGDGAALQDAVAEEWWFVHAAH